MRLRQLSTFCKIVECESFSRAATELYMSQPAVSLQVQALERDLRAKLFERRGNKIVLTSAGEVLYRRARVAVATLDEALRMIQELKEGARGRVLLGMGNDGTADLIPALLRGFVSDNPGAELTLSVDSGEQMKKQVLDYQLDLALVWGPVEDRHLEGMVLCRTCFTLVGAPSHPLARSERLSPGDIDAQAFVLHSSADARTFFEGVMRSAGISFRCVSQTQHVEAIKRAVELNLGLAFLPMRSVQDEVQQGRLSRLDVPGLEAWRPLVAIHRRDRELPPMVQRLLGDLKTHARQQTGVGVVASTVEDELLTSRPHWLPFISGMAEGKE